jgi:uncharacterized membrane protein YdfJ with MMPL/SSD domain
VQLSQQRAGLTLVEAYRRAIAFTGKVVGLVGFTLAAGVVTWAWSPIKFQADMGIMLTFMFLWNMIGALTLIPALSCLLLPRVVSTVGGRTTFSVPRERSSSEGSLKERRGGESTQNEERFRSVIRAVMPASVAH